MWYNMALMDSAVAVVIGAIVTILVGAILIPIAENIAGENNADTGYLAQALDLTPVIILVAVVVGVIGVLGALRL